MRGRDVPRRYVGLSIEWSLVDRYLGPAARPAFANLLRNLRSGVLRLGGSSQDLMPFDPTVADDIRLITLPDLRDVRDTLDAVNRGQLKVPGDAPPWEVVLGTAMAPNTPDRPWITPQHALSFRTQGVEPVFAGAAARLVAGLELGNEPDLSYRSDLSAYLLDLERYTGAGAVDGLGLFAPDTSEPIAPWSSIRAGATPLRFFAAWPAILDAVATLDTQGARPSEVIATDHFYPMSRACPTDPYRCPSIPALLSDERMDNLQYVVGTHAGEAAQRGLGYRVDELNSASGRGAPGVSEVAASATWALDALFSSACPQPPDAPGTNLACTNGAIGVNFHNAEVRAFFEPQEGNAYYNPIAFDPSPAGGPPTPRPEYYALLFFAALAQGERALRPVPVALGEPGLANVKAWLVRDRGERRLFLLNKGAGPTTVTIGGARGRYAVDRLSPYDPTGAGRTLDAPEVQLDARSVDQAGRWPGLLPTTGRPQHGQLALTLVAGEAAALTFAGR